MKTVWTAKEAETYLAENGFSFDRQSGSHRIWLNKETGRRCTVPMHGGDIKPGTLSNMRRESGLSFR